MIVEQQFTVIVSMIKTAQGNAYRAVNTELINLYWNIGAYIHIHVENAKWGDKTVAELAKFIKNNNPDLKGFDRRGLYRMKQFYQTYHNSSIVSTAMTQFQKDENQENTIVSMALTQFEMQDIKTTILAKVGWSNHLAIFGKCKKEEERKFYLSLCIKENYTFKELERQINSSLFERMLISNQAFSTLPAVLPANFENIFKETYVLDFLNLPEPYSENDLQKELVKQMKHFIAELGKDFLFVGEEYGVQVGNKDYRLDLLFYHRELHCLVAIELKITDFEPEHLSKLNFYLEALDRDVKKAHENPSIGILLCKGKDEEVVEYALSRNISPTLISQYTLALPNKEVLQNKLHEIYELFESRNNSENQLKKEEE
jgi:predicted nuclease of restriction endonuclease-like (RecB) superfamily